MLLGIEHLSVSYETQKGPVKAVDDVSFVINGGDTFGIVGESGCGKSTILRSILRIHPANATLKGTIQFKGRNILELPEKELNEVRWKEIAIIPQSAMSALDPVYRISSQIHEAISAHVPITKEGAIEKVKEMFSMVGISHTRMMDYPHQFSGGMRQRAMIAMALVLNPCLLLVDEPTTALDVIVQGQILSKMVEMIRRQGNSMIFITHDVGIIAQTCERLAVMYAGRLIEMGDTVDVFESAYHPYTLGLINAFPDISRRKHLVSIPGFPPYLLHPIKGCRFEKRCPFAEERCRIEEPLPLDVGKDHIVMCHFIDRADEFRYASKNEEIWKKKS